MRLKFLLIGLVALVGSLSSLMAVASSQKPEDFVGQFYAWYIAADRGDTPADMNTGLYKFVEKATADRVRADIKRGSVPDGVGYFTKVQDYNPDEWKNNTSIHPAVILNKSVALVAVTFGRSEKTDVVLFLKKDQGQWKIIKAEDTLPYP